MLSSYMEALVLSFRISTLFETNGIASLPTKIKKFTVNKSPHIDKKSRDQFEIRTYTKVVSIIGQFKQIMSKILNINIPEGVYISIKIDNSIFNSKEYKIGISD